MKMENTGNSVEENGCVASEDVGEKRSQWKKSHFCFMVCVGIFIGVVLKLFVVDLLHVSGRSMMPSIKDGETIVVNKLAYGIVKPYGDSLLVQWSEPKSGDVVIYLYNDKIVVKRCVAVGGDLLEYSINPLYTLEIDGDGIPLNEVQYHNLKDSKYVPDGYILAVGDNYEESVDSRTYGFVSTKNILGKVLCK